MGSQPSSADFDRPTLPVTPLTPLTPLIPADPAPAAHPVGLGGFLSDSQMGEVEMKPAEAPPSLEGSAPDIGPIGPGSAVGPYTLVSTLGEGGFGVVYLARQSQPVRRQVALKIIKLGMDTGEVLARFEAERQTLALMDHPGVAKVLDAGATPGGRPYFVMEHVQGAPITTYCDAEKLSVPERLQLFVEVCRAVQHAHQRGIIHRDLKPSNILVATVDGKPAPKVIDFGIAKAMGAQAGAADEATPRTEIGRLMGTPEYMSPEQTGSAGDVDTRSDVYSLGVILYQLLTGELPFDGRALRAGGYDGIRRMILAVEPPKPSTRVSSLLDSVGAGGASGSAIQDSARKRATDATSLRRTLRGDLDWIVMRALEKNRERRYESASSLGEDVLRYLENRPVVAGPPSASYRVRKFVRRHRAGVAFGSALALTIAGSVVALGVLYAQAQHDRRRAQSESARATAALGFVDDMFATIDPSAAQGREVTVREVLAQAKTKAAETRWGDERVEATVRQILARAYHQLGDDEQAEENARRVVEVRTRALGPLHPETLSGQHDLAAVLIGRGQMDEARKLLQAAMEGRSRTLGEDSQDALASRSLMAALLQRTGDYAAAETMARSVAAAQSRTLGPAHHDTIDTRLSVADCLEHLGKLDEARKESQEIAEVAAKSLGEADPLTLTALSMQSSTLQTLGKLDEAERIDRRLVEIRTRVLGPDHRETLLSMGQLGETLKSQGKLSEAEAIRREAATRSERAFGPDHPFTLGCLHNLAAVLHIQGKNPDKLDEAERLYRRCVEGREKAEGPESRGTLTSLNQIGLLLMDRGRPGEALPMLQRVLAGLEKQLPAEHWMLGASRICVGECLLDLGRPEEAEPLLADAATQLGKTLGPDHPRTKRAAEGLAKARAGMPGTSPKPAE